MAPLAHLDVVTDVDVRVELGAPADDGGREGAGVDGGQGAHLGVVLDAHAAELGDAHDGAARPRGPAEARAAHDRARADHGALARTTLPPYTTALGSTAGAGPDAGAGEDDRAGADGRGGVYLGRGVDVHAPRRSNVGSSGGAASRGSAASAKPASGWTQRRPAGTFAASAASTRRAASPARAAST